MDLVADERRPGPWMIRRRFVLGVELPCSPELLIISVAAAR